MWKIFVGWDLTDCDKNSVGLWKVVENHPVARGGSRGYVQAGSAIGSGLKLLAGDTKNAHKEVQAGSAIGSGLKLLLERCREAKPWVQAGSAIGSGLKLKESLKAFSVVRSGWFRDWKRIETLLACGIQLGLHVQAGSAIGSGLKQGSEDCCSYSQVQAGSAIGSGLKHIAIGVAGGDVAAPFRTVPRLEADLSFGWGDGLRGAVKAHAAALFLRGVRSLFWAVNPRPRCPIQSSRHSKAGCHHCSYS